MKNPRHDKLIYDNLKNLYIFLVWFSLMLVLGANVVCPGLYFVPMFVGIELFKWRLQVSVVVRSVCGIILNSL